MTLIDDLNPSRFLVAGDWHASLGQGLAAVGLAQSIGDDVKVIVQLGDFFYNDMLFLKGLNNQLEKLDMYVLFIDGNHEDFNYLYSRPTTPDGYRPLRSRIYHLPRGFRWQWGELKFAALGGAHSVDRDVRRENESWWSQEWVTDEELETFRSSGPADVVFMHDSPAGAPNSVTDDPLRQLSAVRYFGQQNIDLATEHRRRLATAVDPTDPALVMHGHFHENMSGHYTRAGGRECRVFGLADGGYGANRSTFLFDIDKLAPQYSRELNTNA